MNHANISKNEKNDAFFSKKNRCEFINADSHLFFFIEISFENSDMFVDSMKVRPIVDDDLSEFEKFTLFSKKKINSKSFNYHNSGKTS